jgi:hypothetical protein
MVNRSVNRIYLTPQAQTMIVIAGAFALATLRLLVNSE